MKARPVTGPTYESWRQKLLWLIIGTIVAVIVTALLTDVGESVVDRIRGDGSYSITRPGCDTDKARHWSVVKSVITCHSGRTKVAKSNNWRGRIADDNGELRFRLQDREFPDDYEVSVTVSDPSSEGACAGLTVHANAAGTTFEELAVCTNGKVSIIRVWDGQEVGRDERVLTYKGTFNLRAVVTAATTTFTADNDQGVSTTFTGSAILPTTSYLGLTVFWKSDEASAGFSGFRFSGRGSG